jgi:hypothetical protein
MLIKNTIRNLLKLLLIGLLLAGGVVFYMFNLPQRDVQATATDYNLTSSQIVSEYLKNPTVANEKYLNEEGDSKILEIKGTVAVISEDFNSQKVVLLQSTTDSAGVSCTFISVSDTFVNQLKIGETISVKGVIRSGASFDHDLDMYENVIMEKCAIVSK